MTATAAEIAQVRRMTAEPTTTTYSDAVIQGYIESYPLVDDLGTDPYYWDTSTTPPTQTATTGWIPTYDLHAAAAAIWEEKAATLADGYDFSTEGQSFTRSQAYEQAKKMARFHASQRQAKTMTQIMKPDENPDNRAVWIGNLAEPPDPPYQGYP